METVNMVTIKIIDQLGNILHSQILQESKGLAHLDISSAELNSGQYTCRIVRGNKEQNITFTKN